MATASGPDGEELERRLFSAVCYPEEDPRFVPDWSEVHRQLAWKGVTLQLVWQEYKQDHPDGFQYTQFSVRYRALRETLDLPMRQEQKAGERMFLDYCGQTMPVTDGKSGGVRKARISVPVLGERSYR